MENYFKKNFENKSNNTKNINTSFVKNILGKIYKKSRDYLDMIINLDKICLKYSPLYINILIIKKSLEEILLNEFDKNCPNSNNNETREKFREKNFSYFREIMKDFYIIDYESSEQYKQLIAHEELQKIFNGNDNINNDTIDNNAEIPEKKNKKFNNTMDNGFYKRLKIPINNPINNSNTQFTFNNNAKKIKNNDNEKKNDDLDSNLNINEIRKSQMIKENDKANKTKKLNKIHIARINTYNTLDNNLKDKDKKNYIKEKMKTESESNSPLEKKSSNKYLNIKKINKNKKQKIKSLNEKVNHTFDTNENNQIKLESNINSNENKKPYLKKLIVLNSNKEIRDSILNSNSIKASTSKHFYSSKIKPLQTNNAKLVEFYLNSKNFSTHDNNNCSYISLYYNKVKAKSMSKNKKCINTSIGQKYKKKIKNILNENESIMKDKDNNSDKEKEKIKYTTGKNFYPYKLKKIMVNINKEQEMKSININKKLKTKKLSLILSKKNSELSYTLKEINKSFEKNIIEEYNKKGCITSRNNINEKDEIKTNINNKKYDSKNNKYENNKNIAINVNKNNKIIKKAKNNTINVNISNDKPIPKKISFRNSINNNNNIYDCSLTSRDDKIKISDNKAEDKFQSSIYQIIQKTKNLFTKKEKGNNKKKSNNNNFYKTQRNFYKKNNDKNINEVNDEKSKEKTYAENVINKIKINNKKVVNKNINSKNSSTININKNINNNKGVIKIPQLNLSNAILNARNSYTLNSLNNKYNTQRNKNIDIKINNNNPNTKRKEINNIFHKLPFNKKIGNK